MRTTRPLAPLLAPLFAVAFLFGSALAQPTADDPLVLRYAASSVEGNWHTEALYLFKEYVERSTRGALEVEIYPNDTLFRQGTQAAAMERGNLEMGPASVQDLSSRLESLSYLTAGYLVTSPSQLCALWESDIGDEIRAQVAEEMGVRIFKPLYLGARQINLVQTRDELEVRTPDDLDGIQLRMPGAETWVFLGRALGASPTPMALTEVYLGLQTGTIDGQDNPLSNTQARKFHEVTNQIVLTNHLLSGPLMGMALDVWNELSESQQAIVEEGIDVAVEFNNRNRIREEADLVDFMRDQGLEVYEPDINAFQTAVQDAYSASAYAEAWPEGILERVNSVDIGPECRY